MKLHEWVRERLDNTPGLTQKGLAERMGVNPAAVNRMLHGRRNIRADEVPVIESYLGARFDASENAPQYSQAQGASARPPGLSDGGAVPYHPAPEHPAWAETMVPVYGYAAGSLQEGLSLANGEVVDWVLRHPQQQGIRDAFAIYVFSDSMEPRYFPGELVYVHPGRPPERNRDCVVERLNGDAYIKRYLGQTDTHVRLAQFNPQKSFKWPKDDIKSIYAVIGRG